MLIIDLYLLTSKTINCLMICATYLLLQVLTSYLRKQIIVVEWYGTYYFCTSRFARTKVVVTISKDIVQVPVRISS